MHRPDRPHQIPPLLHQGKNLGRFAGQRGGDIQQDINLLAPQVQRVHMWDCPAIDHGCVLVEHLPGLDDAIVGFFGGHGGRQ